MNVEFEVKKILKENDNTNLKVKMICKISTFEESLVLKAIKNGGGKASEIYQNIIDLHKNADI